MDLVRLTGARSGAFARGEWSFKAGEHWAVVGADGAAKALFCALVADLVPPPRGVSVDFADGLAESVQLVSFAQQRRAAEKVGFLQARYCSIEDDAGPGDTVADVLSFNRIFDVNPFEVGRPLRRERRQFRETLPRVVRLLNLTDFLPRPFHSLSNGETRRVLLARALLANPALLVLDDPCAGLDPDRREQVKGICNALAARGISLLVAVRHEDEIPACVTHVLEISCGRFVRQGPYAPSQVARPAQPRIAPGARTSRSAEATPQGQRAARPSSGGPIVFDLRNITLAFGRRRLFDGLSWTVRAGEHWVLRGANGSGKTTLLSLVTGDNPKAYANDVTVFGHRRGVGEELAKTRRQIGMVSPEQQAYLGLGAEELLEAALAKNPKLLLLDEPCLNLDAPQAAKLKRRVAAWLRRHPQTAAVCVAHRVEDIPAGFDRELVL